MDAGRVDPSLLRAQAADAATAARAFTPGQHLVGRVLQALADQHFLVAFGDRRVVAQTALPLAPGQEIAVDVIASGRVIELRLASAGVPASGVDETRLALGALLTAARAGSAAGPAAPPPDAASFLRAAAAAQQQATAPLAASQLDALARLLTALPLGGGRPLAALIQDAFLNSGVLFEARLRAALTANPSLTNEQALIQLQADLKTLLGRLARAATSAPAADDDDPSETSAAPAPLAAGDERVPSGAPTLADQHRSLSERVLARQTECALRWLSDGTIRMDLPVQLPWGEAQAKIALRRDAPADGEAQDRPAYRVVLRVESERVGAIEAEAHWGAGSLQAVFFVESPDTRDLLLPELEPLRRALGATFAQVTADVRVDPARLRQLDGQNVLPELPGGSIVSVRA